MDWGPSDRHQVILRHDMLISGDPKAFPAKDRQGDGPRGASELSLKGTWLLPIPVTHECSTNQRVTPLQKSHEKGNRERWENQEVTLAVYTLKKTNWCRESHKLTHSKWSLILACSPFLNQRNGSAFFQTLGSHLLTLPLRARWEMLCEGLGWSEAPSSKFCLPQRPVGRPTASCYSYLSPLGIFQMTLRSTEGLLIMDMKTHFATVF